MFSKLNSISPFQIIIISFAAIIMFGSILLSLPISSAGGQATGFSDALFTSVSAVCVTGLVVQDTATYWSGFGQVVILFLIQIGGLGVVTAAAAVSLISGKRIHLSQRTTMQEAVSAPQIGGVVRFTGFIFRFTFAAELVGFALMAPVFCMKLDFWKGLWYALFHSVSAFCNAGFDLMGINHPYSSLTSFVGNPLINIVVMLLIISGGLGFSVWEDIKTNHFHLKKYRLQSKAVLLVTLVLIIVPALYFYIFEFSGWDMSGGERVLASLFQSITPRTAGFNTVDLTAMKSSSLALIIVLMLIGGSTGSTAGGMKTTTLAVLISSALGVFRSKKDTRMFGRRIENETVSKASALLLMYLFAFFIGGFAICLFEGLPVSDCLFEAASAIGTVGLSTGITSSLGTASRVVLMCLMFFGRVGGLTFVFAAFTPKHEDLSRLPPEKINIG
ncbi:MAG: TrkH family potassium uptake protein [Oscillospiraceae bacterium]